jgi:hypothetical protein
MASDRPGPDGDTNARGHGDNTVERGDVARASAPTDPQAGRDAVIRLYDSVLPRSESPLPSAEAGRPRKTGEEGVIGQMYGPLVTPSDSPAESSAAQHHEPDIEPDDDESATSTVHDGEPAEIAPTGDDAAETSSDTADDPRSAVAIGDHGSTSERSTAEAALADDTEHAVRSTATPVSGPDPSDRDVLENPNVPDRPNIRDEQLTEQPDRDSWDAQKRQERGDLGPDWEPLPVTKIPQSYGCDEVADKVVREIGGERGRIEPSVEETVLGPYRGVHAPWYYHTVVVLDGRVYDAFTGRDGVPIEEYKDLWQYRDDIDFDF